MLLTVKHERPSRRSDREKLVSNGFKKRGVNIVASAAVACCERTKEGGSPSLPSLPSLALPRPPSPLAHRASPRSRSDRSDRSDRF